MQLRSPLSLKVKPGKIIAGRIKDVPLANGTKIRVGPGVVGHVITVTPADKCTIARIPFEGGKLVVSRQTIRITANLKRMASVVEVENGQIPESAVACYCE